MVVKREEYKPKLYGLSSQNEPCVDVYVTSNVRQYTDMYYAYEKFKNIFNMNEYNFFLANGCENAMKNVLLALKPKTMSWAIPTWRMPEVYCAALDIEPITKEYHYNKSNNEIIYPKELLDINSDVLYLNYLNTTGFKYDFQYYMYSETVKSKYIILDITYQTVKDMVHLIERLTNLENDKLIIIGSFDKCVGTGLRLGFAIYPQHLHNAMALQREQYINNCAYNWLINTEKDDILQYPLTPYKDELLRLCSKEDYLTDNFITIKGNIETTLPVFHFKIDEEDFTRFGIPSNETEFQSIKTVINHFKKRIK